MAAQGSCVLELEDRLEKFLEGPSELDIEDGVDDGVDEAVHVPQPDEEREEDGVQLADTADQIVPDADGVHDVDGEKGHPAEQEDSCEWMDLEFLI